MMLCGRQLACDVFDVVAFGEWLAFGGDVENFDIYFTDFLRVDVVDCGYVWLRMMLTFTFLRVMKSSVMGFLGIGVMLSFVIIKVSRLSYSLNCVRTMWLQMRVFISFISKYVVNSQL